MLLKSISNGALFYSDQVSKIIQELQPPAPEPTEEEIPESKKNWLHEVKMWFQIFKILKDLNLKWFTISKQLLVWH